MATEDSIRWNQRYNTTPRAWFSNPRSFLINNLHLLPQQGLALDLAMGPGQNSALLVERGLDVIGIDISSEAVMQAKRRSPRLMAVIADLEHVSLPSNTFDVVLNFYYLQRALFPDFRRILKPGGLLVFETLTREMLTARPDIEPGYLLEEGELRDAFRDWEILVYHEGWITSDHGHQKAVASMIARCP